MNSQPAPYPLGHTSAELDRLIAQGRYLGELTEHVFTLAGIGPGMRVLDVGCGAGDVSFLVARMIGPSGSVVGIDRAPEATELARQRAAQASLTNVRFVTGDITGPLPLDHQVDAIVGRLVLMYFADPGAVVRSLTQVLVPGGVVCFHELNTSSTASEPRCELFHLTGQRIEDTFVRAGANTRTGLRLPAIFRHAGLPPPTLLQLCHVEHAPDGEGYQYLAAVTRTLLPLMEKTGVATAAEVDIDTLAGRLREEVLTRGAVVVMPALVGGWARTRQ